MGSNRGAADLGSDDEVRPRGTSASWEIAEAVIIAASRGDRAAFTAIVEHYDDRLRTLAFNVLRSSDDLDDAMQDAYVKAYRGLSAFRGSSTLGAWLHRITYTTCLNILRSHARRPAQSDSVLSERAAVGADPAETVAGADAFERLLAAISPEQRAVVVLIDAQGHTYAEASEMLGLPAGTIASRLSSAHARLRSGLDTGAHEDVSVDGTEART
jgi:RNA polymerase sigma-70 factor (ECF subfamily)